MIKTKTQKAQHHVTEHKHDKAQLGDPPHLSIGLALSSSPNKIKIWGNIGRQMRLFMTESSTMLLLGSILTLFSGKKAGRVDKTERMSYFSI